MPGIKEGELDSLLGHYLHRASINLRSQANSALAALGITSKSYVALTLIEANPGISQSDLGRRLGTALPNVARQLSALQSRAIIRREDAGRHTYALSLTESGQELMRHCHKVVKAQEDILKSRLTNREAADIFRILQKLW